MGMTWNVRGTHNNYPVFVAQAGNEIAIARVKYHGRWEVDFCNEDEPELITASSPRFSTISEAASWASDFAKVKEEFED